MVTVSYSKYFLSQSKKLPKSQQEKLAKLIEFCRKGPASARVEDVKVDYEEAKNEFKGFEIRYD